MQFIDTFAPLSSLYDALRDLSFTLQTEGVTPDNREALQTAIYHCLTELERAGF